MKALERKERGAAFILLLDHAKLRPIPDGGLPKIISQYHFSSKLQKPVLTLNSDFFLKKKNEILTE